MLNTIADKVYVITTIDARRADHIHSQLVDVDFSFVVAPETCILTNDIVLHGPDSRPAISLASTNISLYKMARLNNYHSICILEDDCFFVEDWKVKFSQFYQELPVDWDVLNLGYHYTQDNLVLQRHSQNVNVISGEFFTTHCMVIRNTVYEELIRIQRNSGYKLPADWVYIHLYQNKQYKCYSPVQPFVYQLSVRGDQNHNIPNCNDRFSSLIG